jgi:hypothetical protein
VKDSKDLEQRVSAYLDALRRAKADGRGAPVYREDGSIAIDWSIKVGEQITISEK